MSKIELTRKWWAANRPKEVKAPELEKVLAAVEQSKGTALAAALSAVPDLVAKVVKGLDKKSQKELIKNLDALSSLASTEAEKAAAIARAEEAKAKTSEKAKLPRKVQEEEGEREQAGEAEDEETPEDKLFEPDFLRKVLKQALSKPLNFGFAIGVKPEQCAFSVARGGTARKLAKLAKDHTGSPKVCWGKVQADENDPLLLTISLESPPMAGIAKALRKHLQLQHVTVFKKFRVLVEGQETESDGGSDEASSTVAAPAVPAATPSVAPIALTAAPQARRTTPPPVPETSSKPPTPEELVVLEDKRREFKKARAAWVAVKAKAEEDLEKVKDGAHLAYLADANQFPKIVQGCKNIDDILDNLDDELRDTLDKYASTPLQNQAKLHQLGKTAGEILDRYQSYVAGSQLMKAIDKKEFADVTIHGPISKALADLRKTLS